MDESPKFPRHKRNRGRRTRRWRQILDRKWNRSCAMHPAIIIGTDRSFWTWLWGRNHVPQNVFLVLFKFVFVCFLCTTSFWWIKDLYINATVPSKIKHNKTKYVTQCGHWCNFRITTTGCDFDLDLWPLTVRLPKLIISFTFYLAIYFPPALDAPLS